MYCVLQYVHDNSNLGHLVYTNTLGMGDSDSHVLLNGCVGQETHVHLLRTFQFMLSLPCVSDVRNYLNI
jgi:hypothetical protein